MKLAHVTVAAVVLAAGGLASAQSLTTALSTTGSGGVFMDLTPTGSGLYVTSFDVQYTGTVGTAVEVEIWTRPGSYVGFDGSNSGWVLHQTVGAIRQGTAVSSPLVPTVPIEVPAGNTTGVYLHCITSGGGIRYIGSGATSFSNADLMLFSDVARTGNIPFGGSRFTPRIFAGTVYYQPGGPAIPGGCCLPDTTCLQTNEFHCTWVGGTFMGDNSDCAACPAQTAGVWLARPAAPQGLVGAAGILLDDTFYLLSGARNGGIRYDTDNYKFDIVNGVWSTIASTPHTGAPAPQQGGISNHTAGAIGSDIYVVAGWAGTIPGAISRVLKYDTLADIWEEIWTDPYPIAVYSPGSAVHNGKLYVLGGGTAPGAPTQENYVYDPGAPAGSRWSPIAPFDVPRIGVAARAFGDKIYAVGGEAADEDRVDVYDIATNTWSAGPPMTSFRGGTALYNLDGKPYAASGGWSSYVTSGEILDNGTWVAGPSVIQGMRNMAADGNATWLVRSTGYDGAYQPYTETMRLDSTPACYANCDGSTVEPILNVEDFTCFINEFASAQVLPPSQQASHYANCDGSSTQPVLNVEDFTCFINRFAQGCP
jgi:hypothetical protein